MISTDGTEQTKRKNPLREEADRTADKKNKNKSANIIINGYDLNIPINLPSAIIGDKGSGKTTLIKSLINLSDKYNIFNKIFFIYSPRTWDEELPTNVIKIDINDALPFLSAYFEIKAIYNSYIKYFKKINFSHIQEKENKGKLPPEGMERITEEEFLNMTDNNIIKYNQKALNMLKTPQEKFNAVIDTGERIIKKFSKPFYIGLNRIDGIKADDRDLLIIDDIAIASKELFTNIKDNDLYEYFTLTRHMRICPILSGQQVDQIPRFLRREIQAWILSRSTNTELLKGIITQSNLKKINEEQQRLKQYEFIVFNQVSQTMNIL